MKYTKIIVIFMILFPITSLSEALKSVTIEEMRIRPAGSNSIIKFSSKFTNLCQDNGIYGLLRTDATEGAKLAWSVLMTAYATGKPVTIITNDTCAYHNEITEVILSK